MSINRWRGLFFSVLSGALAGLAASFFLTALEVTTHFRQIHPELLWGLPLGGLFIGWIYTRFGKGTDAGHNLILEEIHDPKGITPKRFSFLILGTTLITHLFGGSAGREGVAVQMGASLSDQLGRFFELTATERKNLLISGAGAGFGAVMGAPMAGIIFGMEVIHCGRLKPVAFFECTLASWIEYGVTRILSAPHTHFPHFEGSSMNPRWLLAAILASVFFGLLARLYIFTTQLVEKAQHKLFESLAARAFIGGLLLVVLYQFFHLQAYAGLSLEFIQGAMAHPTDGWIPLIKLGLTALTIGSGFKGGEFIPLVLIGTTAGSALAIFEPSSHAVLSAVGFAAVFAAASNTPITCSIMAAELFGWEIAPYATVACFIAWFVSGKSTIYRSQRILHR